MPASSWLVWTSRARARLAFRLNSLDRASSSSATPRWVVPSQKMVIRSSPKIAVALPPYGIFGTDPSTAFSLLRGEAVVEAFAADLAELLDRAARGRVRGVPRRRVLAASLAIVMADLRAAAALRAVGPVVTGRGRRRA